MINRNLALAATSLALLCFFSACTSPPPAKQAEQERAASQPPAEAPKPPEAKPEEKKEAPASTTKVRLDTSVGPIVIELHRDWAPLGAKQFEQLVKSGFFDGARFFRVVPNFVVQFGLAGNPATTKKWDKPINDDPVLQTNRRGSVVFATAGPNTRTSQIFINLRSNQSLDSQGFSPFGMVVEGMDNVEKIYAGYGEEPDQERITARGNAYLTATFPKLDFIKKAVVE